MATPVMSNPSITTIGCDIGGVIKNQQNDEPIANAVESILTLSENVSNTVLFISKCKDSYKEKSNLWLREHNLSHIKTFYCLEYGEKFQIALDNKVRVMIDDRMQVLRTFPSSIIKIWFCTDSRNIEGAKKHQPDFVDSVRIARNWNDILALIDEIQSF